MSHVLVRKTIAYRVLNLKIRIKAYAYCKICLNITYVWSCFDNSVNVNLIGRVLGIFFKDYISKTETFGSFSHACQFRGP